MLRLNNIRKDYYAGDTVVHALRGVSVRFRKNEFVAVLGPSGCGKTTLLNIIGGLDRYTDGDLFIAGRSTKEFRDSDWDTYRNHSIGFVFQNYNLIPHQTVLSNVELALTLSGVSKGERRKRAVEALGRVGLADQLHKKPNQMSGGQMQRVAIARALVNDPEILLADEPTGALDSATSVQIMEILKEISCDKLVIMVTHNPELAQQYATRTVKLLDGEIVSDSDPCEVAEFEAVKTERKPKSSSKTAGKGAGAKTKTKKKKVSMSFWTALSLSLNNLMTKKGRTILTSFAGSIGIIGIALILSLSNGINSYIQSVQEETLASYPISIYEEEADLSAMLTTITGVRQQQESKHDHDAVYSSSVMYELINSMLTADRKKNDLKSFKKWLESNEDIQNYITAVKYSYNIDLNVYARDAASGNYVNADIEELMSTVSGANSSFTGMYSQFAGIVVFEELLPGNRNENGEYEGDGYVSGMLRDQQYDLVCGEWPKDKQDLILVLDKNNEITDITQYALGLVSAEEMQEITMSAMRGTPIEIVDRRWSYDDILALNLKLVLPTEYFDDTDGDGIYEDISQDEAMLNMIVSGGLDLRISGIVRPKEDASSTALRGSIGYTSALTEYIIEKTAESEIVKKQSAPENENFDIFTGLPFVIIEENALTQAEKAAAVKEYIGSMDSAAKAALYRTILSTPTEEEIEEWVEYYLSLYPDRASKEEFIVQQYTASTSYSEDIIRQYLAAYSEEELDGAIREGIKQMVAVQKAQEAEAKLTAIVAASTPEEIAALTEAILDGINPDKDKTEYTKIDKVNYILNSWENSTTMDSGDAAAMILYLNKLSDAELDEKVLTLAKQEAAAKFQEHAAQIINEMQSGQSAAANEKLAAAFDAYMAELSEKDCAALYESVVPSGVSESTLQDNLDKLGAADLSSPSAISIYAGNFEDKDSIATAIEEYNAGMDEESRISYTDYVALLMSSVTRIVDFVSYGLIAFVSISLVVSSIMIGIITYISVLERTKEIGILRSIGASKRNIRTVFNAETLIIGFAAGAFGILVTLLLCFPINAILKYLTDVASIAVMPWQGGVILVAISMLLTLIAGLIPASFASKKDPVIALRTE